MPLTRGRSVRFGGYLHRDSIGAAPSGAAPNFSGGVFQCPTSARDLGPLRVEHGDQERADEPDGNEQQGGVRRERRRITAAAPAPTAEATAAGVNRRPSRGERHVLDDVGQEDRGEGLPEVEGDARADPGQLAARQRGDGESEARLLDDREPAPSSHGGEPGQGVRVGQSRRGHPGDRRAEEREADPEDERDGEPDGEHHRDRDEGRQHVPRPALAARDRVLQRSPAPFRARDRGAVYHGDEPPEPEQERQDEVIGAGEGDQGTGRDAVLRVLRVLADGGRRDDDQAEQADEQAHRDDRRRSLDELAEPRKEDPHAGGLPGPGPRATVAPATPNMPSDEGAPPPVSSRNSISRSVPDSRPEAKMPASARTRLISPARLGSTWTASHGSPSVDVSPSVFATRSSRARASATWARGTRARTRPWSRRSESRVPSRTS